jgi:raffinose/stachyose/melibiose transport system substrate-binding protein
MRHFGSRITKVLASPLLLASLVAATPGLAGASTLRGSTGSEPSITVWDQNTVGNLNPIYNHLVSMFEQKYHVKVDRITKPFTQILEQQKLALSGPNPPDVVQSNQGYGTMGPEVQAHLIIPLTKYEAEYKWNISQPSTILQGNEFSTNGLHFGSGALYGMSDTVGGPVAVYYNVSYLKKLGVTLPVPNLAAFEAVLAKAKAANITPIQFGDLEGWPGIHEFQILWDTYAPGTKPLTQYVYATAPSTFDTPWARKAATTLQSWVKAGYFEPGFTGISYETGWEQFTKGKSLFLISGPWLNGSISSAMGNNVGVMPMPPLKTGEPPVATNSGNNPYVIAANVSQKEQALAAEYINFITSSDAAAQYFVTNQQIPVFFPPGLRVPAGKSLADWLSIWGNLERDNGSVNYMDSSTLQGTTLIGQQVQDLMGMRSSPSAFIDAIEADYSQFQKSL